MTRVRGIVIAAVVSAGLVAFGGCFDFDGAYDRCAASGMCGDAVDSGPGGEDAGVDAGVDAGGDAGSDAGSDAGEEDPGVDAGMDAGTDAGDLDAGMDGGAGCPTGQVCDGGFYDVFDTSVLGMSAVAPDDIWAAGPLQHRYHWDGTDWVLVGKAPEAHSYAAVWAAASNDVWFVGSEAETDRYQGGGDVVTGAAPVTYANGSSIPELRGVYGLASNDVWFTGWSETILHWDGGSFQPVHAPVTGSSNSLNSVWMSDAGTGWAVGDESFFAYADGGWSSTPSPVAGSFTGVWGSAWNDVTAVGSEGVYHFDGSTWSPMLGTASYQLRSVHGVAPDAIVAVGAFGVVLRYDGTKWKKAAQLSSNWGVFAVQMTSRNEVWVGGYDTAQGKGFVQRLVFGP